MKLFGKKKSSFAKVSEDKGEVFDEKNIVQGKLDLKSKKPKDKDFKDLSPENKKQRREPVKPWGKKERIIVLLIFLGTTVPSAFLALSSRSYKLPGSPRFEFPKINIPFFGNTQVYEGNNEDAQKAKEVKDKFQELASDATGLYGLYVIRLKNGSGYGVNETSTFQAASLIKLPVMASMFKEAEEGNVNLDDKYILRAEDKVKGAGSLYYKPNGYQITYRNLLELMGKQSDNTAFKIIRGIVGDEKINKNIIAYGMSKTSLPENLTTPQDIGIFFKNLYQGNILGKTYKEEMLSYLTDTLYENWLKMGVPTEVRVAHKYGKEINVTNDAGIVYAKEPFVIVVMSQGNVEKEADMMIPEIAMVVYETEGK